VYCEKCDLNLTQDNDGCKVTSMALAGRVQRVLAKHEKLHQAKPWSDRDKREARHAMYKAIISWQFCSPLGAGKRVRLPECLLSAVRRSSTSASSSSQEANTLVAEPADSALVTRRWCR